MATTPNMGLVVPDDHTDTDTWGLALNTVFGVSGGGIDAHDHTTGKGVKIPSAALNINADVSWASGGIYYALKDTLAVDFQPSAATSMTAYAGALFCNSADNELYWRTTGGTNVKMTAGNALNVAAFTGGIGGDYAAVGALESYDDATRRYLFQQEGSPRPWAGLATGDLDIYEKAASISNKVTLKSPGGLAASYAVTWLAALPASAMGIAIDNSGTMTAGASFAMQANANITLSGTGTYKQGTKNITMPVIGAYGLDGGAGSVSVTASNVGAKLANNTIWYFPLPVIPHHARIVGVQAWFSSNADATACTCTIYKSSNANPPGTGLTTTGTALSTISTAEASVSSLTLQATNGQSYWLQVGNGVNTPTIVAIGVDYDVP